MNIALIAGGYSGEYSVSLRSQRALMGFLKESPYSIYPVLIRKDEWIVNGEKEYPIDKNNFSFVTDDGERVVFDYAYVTIHGTPGEDGLLTGYLDMLGIPYSCCSTLVGALTFDKYMCTHLLRSFGVHVAKSRRIYRSDIEHIREIAREMGLPVFIKPNTGGSSIATTRVDKEDQLDEALRLGFEESDVLLMEQLMVGTEVTCGCYRDGDGIHALPITEVVTQNTFFDYNAKYNGQVQEITPARLTEEKTKEIRELTKDIYQILNASGIIRVDYIIQGDTPYLLEVNTTPGMTGTSFIPQQVQAAGLDISQVLQDIISYQIAEAQK